jgi:hypothetical protein
MHPALADVFPLILCPQVNEAWFGLNGINDCGDKLVTGGTAHHHLTTHIPRPVISSLAQTFGAPNSVPAPTCDQLRPCWTCTTSNTQADIVSGKCNAACGLQFTAAPVTTPSDSSTASSNPSNPSDPTTVTSSSSSTGSANPSDGSLATKGAASDLAPSALVLLLVALVALLL